MSTLFLAPHSSHRALEALLPPGTQWSQNMIDSLPAACAVRTNGAAIIAEAAADVATNCRRVNFAFFIRLPPSSSLLFFFAGVRHRGGPRETLTRAVQSFSCARRDDARPRVVKSDAIREVRASSVERNRGAARKTAMRGEFSAFASQASLLGVLPRNSFSLLPPDRCRAVCAFDGGAGRRVKVAWHTYGELERRKISSNVNRR